MRTHRLHRGRRGNSSTQNTSGVEVIEVEPGKSVAVITPLLVFKREALRRYTTCRARPQSSFLAFRRTAWLSCRRDSSGVVHVLSRSSLRADCPEQPQRCVPPPFQRVPLCTDRTSSPLRKKSGYDREQTPSYFRYGLRYLPKFGYE